MKSITMADVIIQFTFILIVLSLSLSVSTYSLNHQRRQCSIGKLESCLEPMSQVTDDSNLAFPVTGEQLEDTCHLLRQGDQCVENYVRQCTNHEINTMVWEMVQGAKGVLQHLCKPSNVQFSYLLYADCFKRIAIGPCHQVIEQFQNTSKEFASIKLMMKGVEADEDGVENKVVDQYLRHFCCAYKSSIDCQLDYVQDDCGVEAKEFFAYYIKEISKHVLAEHCLGYTFSDRCNHTTGHIQQTSLMTKVLTNLDRQGNDCFQQYSHFIGNYLIIFFSLFFQSITIV